MSQNEVITLGQQVLYTTLLASAPLLGVGLVVGLVISIFQAITQINEQTLVFVPKIIAIFATLYFAGPWIMRLLMELTLKLFNEINTMVS